MLNVKYWLFFVTSFPCSLKFLLFHLIGHTAHGTLIENMSRTGCIFLEDSMRNSNFGIGALHVKRQILTIFCDVISLLTQFFIVSFDRAYRGVYKKILKTFYGSIFVMWPPSKRNARPCDDCHIFLDDFMRNNNFGIGVLHLKVKYWRIFCDVISLLAQVFIASFDRAYQEVSTKKYW